MSPSSPESNSSFDLAHRRREHERVADHEHELALAGQRHQLARVAGVGRHGLLDEDVLAGLQGRLGERVVRADGRRDEHGVDVGVVEDVTHSPVVAIAGVLGLRPGEGALAAVADPLHLGARHAPVVAQQVRAPVAVPHQRHVHLSRLRQRATLPPTPESRR